MNLHAANSAASADAFAALPDFRGTVSELIGWIATHGGQILVGALIGIGIVLLMMGVRALTIRLCRSARPTSWRGIVGSVAHRTRFWFMVVVAILAVANYAHLPANLMPIVHALGVIAIILQAAGWLQALLIGLVEYRAGSLDQHSGLQSAMDLIRLLINVVLFAVAIILILANLGVNVSGLLAGLGIGGIAIGLAAQGIFSDLFAALSILFDRPFRRGDPIQWDPVSPTSAGTVESIGLKTTRIRAATGEEVIISNANLLNRQIINTARLSQRRIVMKLSVIYQTPVETLKRIPEMVKAVVEAHEHCQLFRCALSNFSPSSLDFDVQYDARQRDYDRIVADRQSIMLGILDAFAAAGIKFAYPTQTSFTAGPDGHAIMPYEITGGGSTGTGT